MFVRSDSSRFSEAAERGLREILMKKMFAAMSVLALAASVASAAIDDAKVAGPYVKVGNAVADAKVAGPYVKIIGAVSDAKVAGPYVKVGDAVADAKVAGPYVKITSAVSDAKVTPAIKASDARAVLNLNAPKTVK
jgi:hypothetical protein